MRSFNLLKKTHKSDRKATHRSQARGGWVYLVYVLKPAWIKSAEHPSTHLHREINQWLLLINKYIEKNFDVSVDKSQEENEAKSNENNAYCFC